MSAAAALNSRLRLRGGANVLAAAQAAGVPRYLRQSIAFWAVPGAGLADEETPLAVDASPAVAADARVVTELEHRLLGVPNIKGIALRYGFFYGPGTWFNPDGDVARQVRELFQFPIVGDGKGVWSWLHVEDAAIAKPLQQQSKAIPDFYLVANDRPVAVHEWLPAFAKWLNAPPPPRLSVEDALKTDGGADAVYYGTQMRGVSNAKAKRELDFQPRPLEWMAEVGLRLFNLEESAQVLRFTSKNKRSSNDEHEIRSGNHTGFGMLIALKRSMRNSVSVWMANFVVTRAVPRASHSAKVRGLDYFLQGSHLRQIWINERARCWQFVMLTQFALT